MNCIIIEDDKLSLRIIEEFINKTSELNLLATDYLLYHSLRWPMIFGGWEVVLEQVWESFSSQKMSPALQ